MTDSANTGAGTADSLALQRTRMASIRTDFALMRTGFTIAAFGAGVTELIGRDTWPDWTADLLTLMFVLVGMLIIHSGLIRSRNSSKELGFEVHQDPFTKWSAEFLPWLLQITLLALLVLMLLH
jgi:uncharacterized membrane protein YidH (DUF202 family)